MQHPWTAWWGFEESWHGETPVGSVDKLNNLLFEGLGGGLVFFHLILTVIFIEVVV